MSTPETQESEQFALRLAQMIADKQGTEIIVLDVSAPLAIADYFVIASARNGRHAVAIGRHLDMTMKHEGLLRRNMAGQDGDSGWILLDFNTIVVHIFDPEAREFYGLENLWADVPRVAFTPVEPKHDADDGWLPDAEESYPDSIGNL